MGRPRGYERIHKTVNLQARTANGDTGEISIPNVNRARVYVRITAMGGTAPTLRVYGEDSPDGNNWYPVSDSGVLNAAGNYAFNMMNPLSDAMRLRWVLGGTSPSVTFELNTYSE